MKSFLVAACVMTALSPLSGCARMLRERVTPFPAGTHAASPWELNRELLMPVNRRILFVVDLVEGNAPETIPLDELAKLAGRYGERPASWLVAGSPGAPRLSWHGSSFTLDSPLDDDTSYIFVGYVGKRLSSFAFGVSYSGHDKSGHKVYVILVNQEAHRKWRSGVLPERVLEQQTLVHEYGHLLGLPPADHGYFTDYPSYVGGAHCVNPDCALSKPRIRALLYGVVNALKHHFLDDYCAECRQAIAKAKAFWRAEARTPSG